MDVKQKISVNEFGKICRVCLISNDFLTTMSSEFLKLYKGLINVQTEEDDKFPTRICKDCCNELESIEHFITKCRANYISLSQSLNEVQIGSSSILYGSLDYTSDKDSDPCKENINNDDILPIDETDNKSNNTTVISLKEDSDAALRTFYCAHCNKGFHTKRKLAVHIKMHSESRPFSCEECNMKFKFRQSLQRHSLVHNGLRAFKCDICGKGFKRAFSRNKHRRVHNRMKPKAASKYSCSECDRILTSYSALSSHMKTHTGEKPYSCSYCGKQFSYISSLTVHTRLHTGETPFICSICNKGYRSSTGLKKHKEVKHFEIVDTKEESKNENAEDKGVSNSDKRECKICNKIFNKHGFGTHMRIHTVAKLLFTCTLCNKNFQKNSHLERHFRIHTGERPYDCKLCGKSFKQDGDLKRHVLIHTGEKTFQCQHCGKQFYTRGSLVSHLAVHTGRKKPVDYMCNICNKSFRQCSHSENHETHPNKEKPYLCTICGKCFTASGTLKVHTRIHTGETPFVCSYCSKGFHNSSSLKRHIMRNHTGEKPHVCMICSKGFHDSTNLKRHIKRVHSVLEIKKENNSLAKSCAV